jgi:hypothetical protein
VFQVVVLPPPDALPDIEEFRRLHDPAFHRVGAHIALLPPFEAPGDTLLERFDAVRFGPSFDVAFGPAAAAGRALQLPVAGPDGVLRALQEELAAALLPAHVERPSAPPALRCGLLGGEAEMELARRALTTLPAPAGFTVREVTLLLEDVRGLWHVVRQKRLASS